MFLYNLEFRTPREGYKYLNHIYMLFLKHSRSRTFSSHYDMLQNILRFCVWASEECSYEIRTIFFLQKIDLDSYKKPSNTANFSHYFWSDIVPTCPDTTRISAYFYVCPSRFLNFAPENDLFPSLRDMKSCMKVEYLLKKTSKYDF